MTFEPAAADRDESSSSAVVQAVPAMSGRERWLSGRALQWHLAVVIWVPGCLVAGWWQVTVALSGDHLAYLYSVEWPVFAIFGAVVWWHLIHDDPETTGGRGLRRLRVEARATGETTTAEVIVRNREEEDDALSAYNDFLSELAAKDQPKTWRRR